MSEPYLYLRSDTGEVITKEQRDAVMAFIRTLFRLEIIAEEQALKIANKYHILFV
jgi:hypothetical protein